MYAISNFRIVSDDKWFRVVDKWGNIVKKFSINKYEIDYVRAWRQGYVQGLNYRVYN